MASLNKVMIIGNVGKDVDMRFTPTGKAVASFSVAVNYKHEDKDETEWFNVSTWNKLAENCNQYLTKGQLVYVEGRQQTRSWETDSVTHYRTELIATVVSFLGKRQNEETEA